MRNGLVTLVLAAGIAVAALFGGMADFCDDCREVQGEVLRLHIPANSDSEEDQRVKLLLRDFLLDSFGEELSRCETLDDALLCAADLLPRIEAECGAFLREQGAEYGCTAELTEMYFPTREYEQLTLPAGEYKALRVTLGSGEGRNWWCVIFPRLCVPAASEPAAEQVGAPSREPSGVLASFANPQPVRVRFWLYEWFAGKFAGR